MGLQINLWECKDCGFIVTDLKHISAHEDPVASPPENWEIIGSGANERMVCARCAVNSDPAISSAVFGATEDLPLNGCQVGMYTITDMSEALTFAISQIEMIMSIRGRPRDDDEIALQATKHRDALLSTQNVIHAIGPIARANTVFNSIQFERPEEDLK